MTKIALADDFTSSDRFSAPRGESGVWTERLDRASILVGGLVLLPGLLLGAVMFVVQSF